MQRYDRDVLAKICYVLDCKCDELIIYNKISKTGYWC